MIFSLRLCTESWKWQWYAKLINDQIFTGNTRNDNQLFVQKRHMNLKPVFFFICVLIYITKNCNILKKYELFFLNDRPLLHSTKGNTRKNDLAVYLNLAYKTY